MYQIKRTATETKFAVAGSNLVATYKEVMLTLFPQSYPEDLVDIFIHNYFQNFGLPVPEKARQFWY